jgi:hypothetical protein
VSRRIPARTALALASGAFGTALLGRSLSSRPDSAEFYALSAGVAGTWVAGAIVAGPIPLADEDARRNGTRELLVKPVAVGAGLFGLFYLAALVSRRIPKLDRALTSVLSYADKGSTPLVVVTTLANAVAEEVFFRGRLYAVVKPRRAVVVSTAGYVLTTTATRNPALVLAAAVMGTVFAVQRRQTGGVLAPAVTHVTWATLMLRFLPPLFHGRHDAAQVPAPVILPL